MEDEDTTPRNRCSLRMKEFGGEGMETETCGERRWCDSHEANQKAHEDRRKPSGPPCERCNRPLAYLRFVGIPLFPVVPPPPSLWDRSQIHDLHPSPRREGAPQGAASFSAPRSAAGGPFTCPAAPSGSRPSGMVLGTIFGKPPPSAPLRPDGPVLLPPASREVTNRPFH